ncbi:ATP-binding protein [Actinoplanes siamensis]|uniref:ATP-binding protein n=1 Tax=Actinoplanes siamensis TaxID=1223317 RepID=UPI001944BAB4|nr:helix-turn-helix domain-containing protein [Actinoplanes siamensis]
MTIVDGLATVLRRHRVAAGLTQEELADLAGVAVRTVRNLELGKVARPRRPTLDLIADRLSLSAAERARLLDAGRPSSAPPVSLPAALPDFVGRRAHLRRITELADAAGPRTVVVAGPPGVGKTSLVVQAGHELAPRFPAGVLYVALRGMDDEPVTIADALGQLLTALGYGRLPETAEGRLTAYRTVTNRGRGLLVLDNARDEAQVRPLLPAGGRWLTLVSSRSRLGGLSAAERITLDVLTDTESQRLLTGAVGAARIGMEPWAAAELGRLCGGLPLALRVAANRLVIRPEWTVRSLADRLRDERHRLDRLHVGDLGVRSAFEVSYRQLDEPARRVLRRLSVAPLPAYSPELVAALAETDEATAEEILETLADAGLAEPARAGDGYRLHDLLALFARDRADAEDHPAEQLAARDRLATHLLRRCSAAGSWLEPEQPCSADTGFSGPHDALAWLDRKQIALWWAVRHTAAQGRHTEVLTAARDLYWYSERRHAALPWPEFFGLAVDAARALRDRRARATQENNLGWALRVTRGRPADAEPHHREALRLGRAAGDPSSVGWALRYLAAVLAARGDTGGALAHLAEAERIFATTGERLAGVVVARAQAEVLRSRGELQAAQDVLETALERWHTGVAERLPGVAIRGYLRTQLGMVQADRGQPDEAMTTLAAAVADFAAGDDVGHTGEAYLSMAAIALERHARKDAEACLDRAAEIFLASDVQHDRLAEVGRLRRSLRRQDARAG